MPTDPPPSVRITPAARDLGEKLTNVILEFRRTRTWLKPREIRLALRIAAANTEAGMPRITLVALAVGLFLVAVIGSVFIAVNAGVDRAVVVPMFAGLLALGVILVILVMRR
jgi:hypothetical protein